MTTADGMERDDLLKLAADLTTTLHRPEAVAVNAGVLLAWAEDAADGEDKRRRLGALEAQARNVRRHAFRQDEDPGAALLAAYADNPAGLVADAAVLHAFMTAPATAGAADNLTMEGLGS